MEVTEFAEVIKSCRMMIHNSNVYYAGAAYSLFQFHKIAMLEDVGNFKCEDIMVDLEYPYTLKSNMCWSENVL